MVFNRSNRSGGGRDFGRRSFNNDRGDRQMFKAICSNCGKECEVPFRPTGSKPVYCSDCFRTMGMGGNDSRRFDDRDSRRPQFDNGSRGSFQPNYKEQFEALNNKLDKILKLLNPEKPETPLVLAEAQTENPMPEKKKIKTKKLVPPAETPSEIPAETPTE